MDACFVLVRLTLRCRNETQISTVTMVWTLTDMLAFHTYLVNKHSQRESLLGTNDENFNCITGMSAAGHYGLRRSAWNYRDNVINYFQGVVPGPSDISAFALTGSVTLNDQNVAVAWSFNDGLSTLTNFNSAGQIIDTVFGPGNKPFVTWGSNLTGVNGEHIRSSFIGSLNEASDFEGRGLVKCP